MHLAATANAVCLVDAWWKSQPALNDRCKDGFLQSREWFGQCHSVKASAYLDIYLHRAFNLISVLPRICSPWMQTLAAWRSEPDMTTAHAQTGSRNSHPALLLWPQAPVRCLDPARPLCMCTKSTELLCAFGCRAA